MPRSDTKEFRRLKKIATNAGWTIDKTKKGHWRFKPPVESGKPMIVTSGSPSDHHSIPNFIALLKKSGLDI